MDLTSHTARGVPAPIDRAIAAAGGTGVDLQVATDNRWLAHLGICNYIIKGVEAVDGAAEEGGAHG